MALRSATAPDLSVSLPAMDAGQTIKFTDPDKTLDNQDWCTQRRSIIAIDCFYPISSGAPAPGQVIARPACNSGLLANYVGAAANTAAWRIGVLCWVDDVTTDYDVELITASGTDSQNFVGTTTPAWRTIPIVNAGFDVRAGAALYPTVRVIRNSGASLVHVAGFGIMV